MAKPTPPDAADPYVAVVYFHGMGSQRRYEESSRLIDAIDAYLSNEFRQRGNSRGMLAKIKPRIEPHNLHDNQTVTYIRTRYLKTRSQKVWDSSEVRFYEAYWAPIMAGTSSPRRVAWWILRQSIRPFQTLRSVWRERQRLRRSALADLEEHTDAWPASTEPGDFDKLLRLYSDFDGLAAKRDFDAGGFDEFRAYIARKFDRDPVSRDRIDRLAQAWHRHYRRTELRNAFFILTILLALALTGGLMVWSVLQLLQLISGLSIISTDAFVFSEMLRDRLSPTWSTAAGLVTSLVLGLGLGRFLSSYMGDVEAWSTYEETDEKHDKRRRVVALGTDLLGHVLADDRCERVLVVSHSLGTSVAHDTLLALARDNRAVNATDPISGPVRLDKIRHFVTMGSPIDKINYFFESYRSAFHRYTRVIETLRGDISDVPFSRNRHPYVHWVNFWDEADIVSGGLHSPVGRQSLGQKVDNVHVANLHFPSPAGSHTAYFGNRQVVGSIFDMAYLGAHSYADAPMNDDNRGRNYAAANLGPGEGRGHARWLFLLGGALPWLGLGYLALAQIDAPGPARAVLWVLIAALIALAGGWLLLRRRGLRLPI